MDENKERELENLDVTENEENPTPEINPETEDAAPASEETVCEEETATEEQENDSEEELVSEEQEIVVTEADIPAELLCERCGERKKVNGKNYCRKCSEEVLRTPLPVMGVAVSFVAFLAGVAALVMIFLNSASTVSVMEAHENYADKCYLTAYNSYYSAIESATEINTSVQSGFGLSKELVVIGDSVYAQMLRAYAKVQTPLSAGSAVATLFDKETLEKEKYADIKEYADIYEELSLVSSMCTSIINDLYNGEISYQETLAELDVIVRENGVEELYHEYFKYMAAVTGGAPAEEQMMMLQKIKSLAPDKDWLYMADMLQLYYDLGEYEKAEEYCDALIEQNRNEAAAYKYKAMIRLINDDKDGAFAVCDEFDEYNIGYADSYNLRAFVTRRFGDLDAAEKLCEEAAEAYASPEAFRQLAIVCLLKGDYDAAFDNAYGAMNSAYYDYSYYGTEEAYAFYQSYEAWATLHLTAYFCSEFGNGAGEYSSEAASMVLADEEKYEDEFEKYWMIVNGELTLEDVFMKGAGEIA